MSVASQIVPANELHALGDTFAAKSALSHVFADIHISTPPCVSWSSLRTPPPKGFNDPSAAVFCASAEIHKLLQKTNPALKVLVENVVPHSGLPKDISRMETLWDVPFCPINAKDLGSPASRLRLFGTNIVDINALQRRSRRADPNQFISDPDVFCSSVSFPCLVACDPTTKNPIKLHYVNQPTSFRHITPHEAEAIQGWPNDITSGRHVPLNLQPLQRIRLLGNGLNAWHMHAILQHLKIAPPSVTVCSTTINESMWKGPADFAPNIDGAYAFEQYLNALDENNLFLWVKHQLVSYVLPELELQLRPGVGPYAKPAHSYHTPSKLNDAITYAIEHYIREGYYEELFHVDHRHWITNAFVKMKDTFWAGTTILKARILGDFRPLNSWLLPPPHHWAWASPDQTSMMMSFPRGSEHFLTCDIADAYHTCRLAESSQNLVVISINGRYFKYKGGAQGLSPMALFWNCHIQDAFYAAFGVHWRHWWATFVDDIGIHGLTAASATARARILSVMLTHIQKPHHFGSAKTSDWTMPPTSSIILAGLHISKNGFSIDDAQLTVLRHVLTEFKVRTKEDAQHVVGVIQYCYSAFRWEGNQSLL